MITLDVLLTGSATPLKEAHISDDDGQSLESMSSANDVQVDTRSKEDQRNKLNRDEDASQEHSNALMQESTSLDGTSRTPPSRLSSKESLMTDKIDDQQPSTHLTTNKIFSEPKIAIEDPSSKLTVAK
jgi:hypothetical protein